MTTNRIPRAPESFAVPRGLLYGAAEGAIKKPGRLDVGVITGERLVAAAVFTTNRFAAAPVIVSREILRRNSGQVAGVVVNSGCANAVTGPRGLEDAWRMSEALGAQVPALVCSTGTIGVHLPMERLLPAVARAKESAGSSAGDFLRLADAILTTDTRRKVAAAGIPGSSAVMVGCAKGAGMIAPSMATMLAFVATDARICAADLQRSVARISNRTLNCLTVDGDTSTNDTLIGISSGCTGPEIVAGSPEHAAFEAALEEVLQSLTIQLAADGEGATTVIEVAVSGARDFAEARAAALKVANSPLVKTAVHGRDANWGRIAMALGNSGAEFEPAEVDIAMESMPLLSRGTPVPFDEGEALRILDTDYLRVSCRIGNGPGEARVWTCDFSKQYIEINGAYRT
jgi:glutamate N-acetyltransferase/amino-acid N-acetyltransferase